MQCEAYKCMHNDGNGYCEDGSYVSIDSEGKCNSFYVPFSAGKDNTKEE